MSFFNKIKNQFGKIIKILRSDNAKQYFLVHFLHSYLPREFYISYHVLTPQHGIALRKNRHLKEIARSLMLNINVSDHH